jgi:hypothetical protein
MRAVKSEEDGGDFSVVRESYLSVGILAGIANE